MTETFRKGDRVEWNSHGSTAAGTVEEKLTSRTEVGGQTVAASEDDPRYLGVLAAVDGGEHAEPQVLRVGFMPEG